MLGYYLSWYPKDLLCHAPVEQLQYKFWPPSLRAEPPILFPPTNALHVFGLEGGAKPLAGDGAQGQMLNRHLSE